MLSRIRMKLAFWLRTRAAMITYATLTFGSGMAWIMWLGFSPFRGLEFPGVLILFAACWMVGACLGECMWQLWERLPWSMKCYRGPDA